MPHEFFNCLLRPLSPRANEAFRVLCGFFFAPFVVYFPCQVLDGFVPGVLSSLLLSIVLFPLTLVLGMPAYLYFRWKGWLGWRHFALAGMVAGFLPALTSLTVSSAPFLFGSLPLDRYPVSLRSIALYLLLYTTAGFLIASSLWLLVHSKLATLNVHIHGRETAP